jgi:uncharacterized protein
MKPQLAAITLAVKSRAQLAGAELPQPARDRAWGIYSGYFRDPDGHLWEVIWNRRTSAAG